MDCERFQSISPPVFFIAIQMIMQPCLVGAEDNIGQRHLRKILTCGSLTFSIGVFLAGIAELIFHEKNLLFSLLYGALGGIGAFLITAILRRIFEKLFGKSDSHLIDVILAGSQAISQLSLPVLLSLIRMEYGREMAVIILGSILLHTLPLVLLISQPHLNQPVHNLVRYHSVKLNDLEMPTNSMKRWGNISGINNNFEEEDQPMKNVTSQGVEILDTIPEEDEGVSGKSVEIQEIKPKEYPEDLPGRKWLFFLEYWQEFLKIFTQLFINPFRYIVERQTLVPGVILKACDVFIYILMVSGLPCYASGSTFSLNFFDTAIFLTLMATPILVVTFSSAWMDDVLREKAKYWHIAGEICKLVGCIGELMITPLNSQFLTLPISSQ